MFSRLLLISLVLSATGGWAQDLSDSRKQEAADVSEAGGLPVVFRTPETGLGLGAVFIYTSDTTATKTSPLITGIMFTERSQMLMAIGTRQNLENGRYAVFAYGDFTRFPQKYYGIGRNTLFKNEETYEERRLTHDLGGEVLIFKDLNLGLGYTGRQDSNHSQSDSGAFQRQEVPGQNGGHQNGYISFLRWDTADDNFYPSRGQKITLSYQNYLKLWGSESPFDSLKFDARFYTQLSSESVLATQLYLYGLNAEPPFYQLAQLGGNDLLRGYFKGRFRDRKMAILQSEWRQGLSKNWRIAIFAGTGNVYHNWDELRPNNLKTSYGTGLRYQITPKQKINLRFDIGIGDPKEGPQVYLYVMEAY